MPLRPSHPSFSDTAAPSTTAYFLANAAAMAFSALPFLNQLIWFSLKVWLTGKL
jgi:hypothetical protein